MRLKTLATTFFMLSLIGGYTNEVDLILLEQAWKIPTGGSHHRPYYSIQVEDTFFPGERNWDERWRLLKDSIDYQDKRILELGSNVALASTYALKYRKARSATAVDRPAALLEEHGTQRLSEAAHLIWDAFGVAIDYEALDLNNSSYEEILGPDYDIVFCTSILKWVEDKERLLSYLSHFNEVIFEGHDSDPIEIERFQRHGFNNFKILGTTHVGTSYPLESTRTLIRFWK